MGDCPIVETSLGEVKGRLLRKPSSGKQVFNYTNLPFAKPPIGELRFEPPCKPEAWQGIRDGSKNSPMPPQDQEFVGKLEKYMVLSADLGVDPLNKSEDCLYLSVYTTNPTKAANLPVLVFFYGGGFSMGSECTYNGNVLCSLNDVVLVIPNYRVNIFGFFSMGKDSDYPGNMGLLDQIRALEWTRDNIRAFGGNPDNVTIFGESAGSMSVSYHVISPLSRGLFHKAISHSGSAVMEGFPLETSEPSVKHLLEQLKITATDPKEIVAKLKALSVEEITAPLRDMMKKLLFFSVCIDGKIFPDVPLRTIEEGKIASVPYIIGCNNTENYGIMTLEQPVGFTEGISEEACMQTLKGYIGAMLIKGLPDSAYDLIVKEYSKGVEDDKFKWSKIYGAIIADVLFVLPTIKTARHHSKNKNKTYLYCMTQQTKFHHDPEYSNDAPKKVPFCECDHGDDLLYTFGMPLDEGKLTIDVKFSDDEKLLSKEWMTYLANFAKNGDPNVGSPVKQKWPLFSLEDQSYLSVQQPCSAKKELLGDRCKFWMEVIEPMKKE